MIVTHENKHLLTPEVLAALAANERKALRNLAKTLDPKKLAPLLTATFGESKLISTVAAALANPVEFEATFPDEYFGGAVAEPDTGTQSDAASDETAWQAVSGPDIPAQLKTDTLAGLTASLDALHKEVAVVAQKTLAAQASIAETRAEVIQLGRSMKAALECLAGGIAVCVASSGGEVPPDAASAFSELGAYLPFKTTQTPPPSEPPATTAATAPASGGRKGKILPPRA